MAARVLSFHYVLTNKEGATLDSSRNADPYPVLEGSRQIIPGLEKALFEMEVGEKKTVYLPAAEAYGLHREELKVEVKRSQLPEGDIQVGTMFKTSNEPDSPVYVVKEMGEETVQLDGNHPLAGQDLTFEVEVVDVREATPEELEHGHAHGPHGHGH